MSFNLRSASKTLFKIGIGFIVAFIFGMIIYTLADFILVMFRLNSDESWGYLSKMLVSFLLFCGLWIFWIKAKTFKLILILLGIVFASYLAGKVYAEKATQQYRKSEQLISEAVNDKAWAESKDPKEYLEGEKANVAKYKEATSLNLDYFPEYKKHVNNFYDLRNELLIIDEKMSTGEVVYTQTELEAKMAEYQARQKTINDKNFVLPFWMVFYNVQ